jgi:hypothetical protein
MKAPRSPGARRHLLARLLAAAPVTVAVLAAGTAAASAAAGGGTAEGGAGHAPAATAAVSGCSVREIRGGWEWICTDQGYGPGGPGAPGGPGPGTGHRTTTLVCTLTRLIRVQAVFLGLRWPPPRGYAWAAISCPGRNPFGGVVLVSLRTGRPAVTPQQLLQVAIGELAPPALPLRTAPPAGMDGLVGLPEWFWVPAAQWRTVSVTVRAGPIWATALATPEQLSFEPGGGLSGVSCPGPGQPYQPRLPASAQHTACSYTYVQSSYGQPGSAYRAALVVSWRVTWTGSGGAGGVVNPSYRVSEPFSQPVAEGQALVTSP